MITTYIPTLNSYERLPENERISFSKDITSTEIYETFTFSCMSLAKTYQPEKFESYNPEEPQIEDLPDQNQDLYDFFGSKKNFEEAYVLLHQVFDFQPKWSEKDSYNHFANLEDFISYATYCLSIKYNLLTEEEKIPEDRIQHANYNGLTKEEVIDKVIFVFEDEIASFASVDDRLIRSGLITSNEKEMKLKPTEVMDEKALVNFVDWLCSYFQIDPEFKDFEEKDIFPTIGDLQSYFIGQVLKKYELYNPDTDEYFQVPQ